MAYDLKRLREIVGSYGMQCQALQLAETEQDIRRMSDAVDAKLKLVLAEYLAAFEAGSEAGGRAHERIARLLAERWAAMPIEAEGYDAYAAGLVEEAIAFARDQFVRELREAFGL